MLKKVLKAFILVFICMLIELLIFNYSGIRTYFMDNKNVEVEYKILDLNGNEYDELGDVSNIITIDNVNIPVSSINFYYKENVNYNLHYILQFSSYSSRYNHNNYIEKIVNINDENYINFYTNSVCESITVTLQSKDEIKLNIDKIVLNKVNINFSFIRFGSLLLIVCLVIYLKKSKKLYLNCNKKSFLYITILIIIIFVAVYLVLMNEFKVIHQIQLLILYICLILLKLIYDEMLKYFKLESISIIVYHIIYLLIVLSSNILYFFSGETSQVYSLLVICLLLSIFVFTLKLLNKGKYIYLYTIITSILVSIIVYINYIIAIFAIPCLVYTFIKIINYDQKIKNKVLVIILCMVLICISIFFSEFKLSCNYEYNEYKFSGLQFARNVLEYISNLPKFELKTYPISNINRTNQEIYTPAEIKGENIFVLGMVYVPVFYLLLLFNTLFKDKKEIKNIYSLYLALSLVFVLLLSYNNVITEDYSIVIKLILSILSSFVFIKIIQKYDNNKEIIYALIVLLMITALIIVPISLSTSKLYLLDKEKELNIFLKNIFLFWQ